MTNIPVDALVVTVLGVGPRVHVPTDGILEPYGLATVGYAAIVPAFVDCPDCDAVFAAGPAAELGGGVDVRLGDHLSAGIRVTGQLLHFGRDAFEQRLREPELERSLTRTTITSFATDAYAMVHF